ncbi:MAG: nascent polypeptide-associated complex protein [Nanoarchaeota archaeon]|nr:nascent polypeptide-associated complex protein [Nanoarchaeota archaeon]MBU1703752.1 nascent polypeptide-associated complex protein [Nanoarchaeota archaeon]
MMPGMNPRMMKQAMKRLGIQQQEIDAYEVIIRTSEKEIVITNPSVSKINMGGQETFQVVGDIEERETSTEPDISEEDVQTVMEQAGVDKETAEKAISENNGDLAAAIMSLKQ